MWRGLWLCLLGLASILALTSALAVMSVDLGSEWIKVAIVSPGVPMEIVLNKESKRKTPVALAFRNGERFFGEDAMTLGVRFPHMSYSYFLTLLGQRANSSAVQEFKTRFPYYKIEEDPERGSVRFRYDDETTFSPEELVAMLLQRARQDAEVFSSQKVSEVVVTVPAYFSQSARRSLLAAIELAGLKPLQLINDYMAVSINYGIFRRKDFNESAQNVIFYDMGASSTVAAVVSFSVSKSRDADPQATVLGVGMDRTLGGLEMQLRLRDYLGKKFNEMKKTPNDVFKNPRAMAKLFKEAGRLKNVLSANADHHAQVEGLLDEVDFKLKVTREEFEGLCQDLFDRAAQPVEQALRAAGLSMEAIKEVVLVGAGMRVPKIQERLSSALGTTLSKNINADEAAAMGAVYKAADLSSGFKVKRFNTKDVVLYPIQVVFDRKLDLEGTEDTPAFKTIRRTLFGFMNPYPQKKLLTFNRHSQDFKFFVNYAELDHLSASDIQYLNALNLTSVELSGLSAAIEKMSGPRVEAKGVKAHFALDDSGILSLAGAEMNFEKTVNESEQKAAEEAEDDSPLSKLGSTISKLFSGDEETKTEAPPAAESSTEAPKDSSSPTSASNDSAPAAEPPKLKVTTIKESLNVVEQRLDLDDLSGTHLKQSKKKLAALDEVDQKRQRHEGALNGLESFILDTRMRLESEEFIAAETETGRETLSTALNGAADWLDEEGYSANTEQLESRLRDLHTKFGPIMARVEEHRNRPEALAALSKIIENSEKFFKVVENQTNHAAEDERIFTEIERTSLSKAIKDTKEWKSKKEKEQETIALSVDPKLTVKMIAEKMATLDREVKYLVNKAKIWRPKKPKEDKPNGDNSTKADQETEKKEGESANSNKTIEVDSKAEKSPEKDSKEIPEKKSEENAAEQVTEMPVAEEVKEGEEKSVPQEEEKELEVEGDEEPKKHEEL